MLAFRVQYCVRLGLLCSIVSNAHQNCGEARHYREVTSASSAKDCGLGADDGPVHGYPFALTNNFVVAKPATFEIPEQLVSDFGIASDGLPDGLLQDF